MIKLTDDQKREVLEELKKYYETSVKNLEELKAKDYSSSLVLDKYESANVEVAEIIDRASKDINNLDDNEWIDLLIYVTTIRLQDEKCKENRKNFDNSNKWWGIVGLIVVSALLDSSVGDNLFNCCCDLDPDPNDKHLK